MLKAAKVKTVGVIEDADKRIENTSLIKHSSESISESRLPTNRPAQCTLLAHSDEAPCESIS